VAFDRVELAPGEAKTITLKIDPTLLSIFDEAKDGWDLLPGEYTVVAGPSSADTPLTATFHMAK
jgi:beta-glucosidase